jgi:hypothetical protein
MNKSFRLVAVLATCMFALGTLLASAQSASKDSAGGQVVSVDTAAKSFVVKTKDGEVTVKYTDTTKFETIKAGTVSDLADGVEAKVVGTISEDQTTIDVTLIELLKADTKIPAAIRTTDKFIIGKLVKDGEKWSVAVGDKKVAMTVPETTKVKIRENAKAEDMVVGKSVWAMLIRSAAEPTAARVQIPVS